VFNNPTTYHLVSGILKSENSSKQILGQKFARYLNLTPGPGGPDDGVDGSTIFNGKKIHFQCKLSREKLDINEARCYYSDIKYHNADISIMLSGLGYLDTFTKRLDGHSDINNHDIYLLTLQDIFEDTKSFNDAKRVLPSLENLIMIVTSCN
jgi:hypothetical protein